MRQDPFRSVFFHLLEGDDVERFFQVDDVNGQLRLRTSLLQDEQLRGSYDVITEYKPDKVNRIILFCNILCLQVRVRASDGGEPARLSNESALLRVNVTRNRFAPRFNSSEYSARIRQDLGVGNSVVRLFAFDDDPPVKTHLISRIG